MSETHDITGLVIAVIMALPILLLAFKVITKFEKRSKRREQVKL